jgi:hypothetical protein
MLPETCIETTGLMKRICVQGPMLSFFANSDYPEHLLFNWMNAFKQATERATSAPMGIIGSFHPLHPALVDHDKDSIHAHVFTTNLRLLDQGALLGSCLTMPSALRPDCMSLALAVEPNYEEQNISTWAAELTHRYFNQNPLTAYDSNALYSVLNFLFAAGGMLELCQAPTAAFTASCDQLQSLLPMCLSLLLLQTLATAAICVATVFCVRKLSIFKGEITSPDIISGNTEAPGHSS